MAQGVDIADTLGGGVAERVVDEQPYLLEGFFHVGETAGVQLRAAHHLAGRVMDADGDRDDASLAEDSPIFQAASTHVTARGAVDVHQPARPAAGERRLPV